nr:MAG TPA: putative transporter family protein [Bacteriophage sp.]
MSLHCRRNRWYTPKTKRKHYLNHPYLLSDSFGR